LSSLLIELDEDLKEKNVLKIEKITIRKLISVNYDNYAVELTAAVREGEDPDKVVEMLNKKVNEYLDKISLGRAKIEEINDKLKGLKYELSKKIAVLAKNQEDLPSRLATLYVKLEKILLEREKGFLSKIFG